MENEKKSHPSGSDDSTDYTEGITCQQCGDIMQRTGACYTCPNCGFNTGCS